MCGVVAVVNPRMLSDRFRQALQALRHRGPDAGDDWCDPTGSVRLGHRRLSIVDLSAAANQPMTNEDKTLQLVCNGEIYNAPALRKELEIRGHEFSSGSDSETVLHAYEEWGTNCLERLEGMFAFVLWDSRRQRLFAARDRVGIKPLYYAEVAGGIVLASELKGVLPLLPVRPEPDPAAMAYVMTIGYVPSPLSIWQGIAKLEAGHYLTWSAEKGIERRCYWEPPRQLASACGNDVDWSERFASVLDEHLLSDVPVGMFLSGGIDSAAVAAGLRELGHRPPALTVSFPSSPFDEAPIAKALCQHLGVDGKILTLEIGDVSNLLERAVQVFEEPQGYSALLSMLLVCEAAAKDFKVVLAGDGGDEVFGGYAWYRQLTDRSSRLAQLKRHFLQGISRSGLSPMGTAQAMSAFSGISSLHSHSMRLFPRFLPEEAAALLEPMGLEFGDEQMLAPFRKHFVPDLPLQRALQRVDLMTFCSDSILAKVDRASMHNSLEVRVPFLDRRIVEWGLQLPVVEREFQEGKPVLRSYLRSRVPGSVLDHPKQGFSLRVLDDFDWEAAIDRIASGPWIRQGRWSPHWRRYLAPGMPYREARIWVLLFLSLWGETWLKEG